MKIDQRISYSNYWDSRIEGTAKVVSIEDTIFEPFEDISEDDLSYTIKDDITGEVFEIDDTDFFVEKLP